MEKVQKGVRAGDADAKAEAAALEAITAQLAEGRPVRTMGDDDAIAVRPRTTGGTLIFFTPSGRSALTFVVVLLVPTLIAMVAAAWASLRRHR